MAWLGTAISLGAVVGPGLGGVLARTAWELRTPSGTVLVSSFSVPFLAAAALALLAFAAALAWLPESRPAHVGADAPADVAQAGAERPGALWPLLALAVAGQFGLALFEATFALYGNRMWSYGPSEIGVAFMVCGLVMAIAQTQPRRPHRDAEQPRANGRALGIQSAANSVGLVLGTLAGGGLLAWQMEALFLVAATVLLLLSAVVGWRVAARPLRPA